MRPPQTISDPSTDDKWLCSSREKRSAKEAVTRELSTPQAYWRPDPVLEVPRIEPPLITVVESESAPGSPLCGPTFNYQQI